MISATVAAGVSDFVREAFGARVLRRANQAVMLDIELIETLDCFIPQSTITTFLDAVERVAGEPDLGLLLAPEVSLSDHGLWGEYVLGAETLRAAVFRAESTLHHHCRGDRVAVSVAGDVARVSYFSAARGLPGYTHLATGTASTVLGLLRQYLSSDWRPRLIELDIPRPRSTARFDDAFSCPVAFDAAGISVQFEAHLLDRPAARRPRARLLTLEDVARGHVGPADPDSVVAVVVAQIWAQVLTGTVSIESTAQALDTSVRSLQRTLNRDGTEFRALTNAVRVQRAKELLKGSLAPITEISTGLGYSTPANFARTFRKATGVTPQAFRRLGRQAGARV